jgi:hypothetical protein
MTQIVDRHGGIHSSANGQYTGRVQVEADAGEVLAPVAGFVSPRELALRDDWANENGASSDDPGVATMAAAASAEAARLDAMLSDRAERAQASLD